MRSKRLISVFFGSCLFFESCAYGLNINNFRKDLEYLDHRLAELSCTLPETQDTLLKINNDLASIQVRYTDITTAKPKFLYRKHVYHATEQLKKLDRLKEKLKDSDFSYVNECDAT